MDPLHGFLVVFGYRFVYLTLQNASKLGIQFIVPAFPWFDMFSDPAHIVYLVSWDWVSS